jgi:hypothetical protein
MKPKIVTIEQDDIIIDHLRQAHLLLDACIKRSVPMTVTGMLQNADKLYFMLTETNITSALKYKYVFAPFPPKQHDEILAELGSRFFYGFSIIGTFYLTAENWVLYRYDSSIDEDIQPDDTFS